MEAAGKAFHQELTDEATCSICLDYFKDPVIIPECGHNFCKTCLDRYWGKSSSKVSCPHCRMMVQRKMVTPNRPLANLIELAKKLALRGEKRARDEGNICDKHQEPQKLFCQDDKVLLCVVCDKSKEHRSHQVIPLEEAFDECKDKLMNCLETLREKREEVLSYKVNTEKESPDLLEQVKAEREKTVRTFRQLHQFLKEQEKLLLAQMEEVMEEIKRERENHLDNLEKERQSLESIIQEMEEKLQQPAVDLLQDIENFIERCEVPKSCENSCITFPAALKWKIWDFCDINPLLEGITKQFQDSLLSGLQLQKAIVCLDPETAHPKLVVSKNCKTVRWMETVQDVPKDDYYWTDFVLGSEEFTTGRHFWEVIVGNEKEWSVGVAKKHVKKEGGVIWDMGKYEDEYQCRTNDFKACVSLNERKWETVYWRARDESYYFKPLNEEPRKIRVALNCEGGRVTFYDADRGTLICEYSEAAFTKKTLRPFYHLTGNAILTLSS